MNTSQLKRFAKEARIKLINQVGRKLEFVLTHDTAELRGKQNEIAQLKQKIQEHSKDHVIETVAYTWFNRLMALRFMDANGYAMPKIVTPLPGMTNPEVLQNALAGNIEEDLKVDRQRINDLLDGRTANADAHTEAYKMLLVAVCNHWHTTMPFMFERISDYTELLLPDDLLSDFSVVADIRNGMSDEDCQQEELIGWLYQFYISDKKDEVFNGLKKNIKISAENIPAATQLFTPRWIVRYMVENTLGKLWLTFKPNSNLRQFMPYYIESPEGNAPAPLPEGIKGIADITFLDPCQGSGHVLVYAFDLLTKIYEEEGYNTNEIPALILKNNLFGIDIDERAAQLAAFALTMKARNYYPRFLRRPIQPHVITLENINEQTIQQSIKLPINVRGKNITSYQDLSLSLLTQANNFGSLIEIEPDEVNSIEIQEGSIWQENEQKLKLEAVFLSKQYHCVVTNPPYMGGKGMNSTLKIFVESHYPKSKSDLMACFMERCLTFNIGNGKTAMINQQSWMFISSYEDIRLLLINNSQFESLLHLGARTFPEIGGEVVQNAAFVLGKYMPINKGVFIRLTDYDNSLLKDHKTLEAIQKTNCSWYYTANQKDFNKIPGNVISGYRIRDNKMYDIFKRNQTLENISISDGQNITADNDKYLRFFWEVNKKKIGTDSKWVFYAKGGNFRKWWGNLSHVVNWSEEARKFYRANNSARIIPEYLWFKRGITWTLLSSSKTGFRILPDFATFDKTGSSIFLKNDGDIEYILALLNSKVISFTLSIFSETTAYQIREIRQIPITEVKINKELFLECISISRSDWDARETSSDFQQNSLIKFEKKSLQKATETHNEYWTNQFQQLHKNEEDLNQKFIEIYGLQDELSAEVNLDEITILQEEAKIVNNQLEIDVFSVLLQLVSYSVGCIFGRYSLNKPGLVLSNQGEMLEDFLKEVSNATFIPDGDNIIPVLDEEWFNDDVVGRFKVFLKAAFGVDDYEENLKFIEAIIGKDIRRYFVKDFYNDHIKRYKKRPIYWMFSSPKGYFKALIYMHRYQPDLCSKMLNDYLQPFINKLEGAKQSQTMFSLREDISAREKALALKEIDKLEAMLKDCREYERTLFTIATQKITIDLDDGVKLNYQKFKDVLVPIKGLEKEEE